MCHFAPRTVHCAQSAMPTPGRLEAGVTAHFAPRTLSSDMGHRALFFDRDGIVNRRRFDDYVKTWEEFEFLPEIFAVLGEVIAAGFHPVLITNQRGISRGLMSLDDLTGIHDRMQQELRLRAGAEFAAIYYCPHGNDDDCDCRKPLPGMLLRAAAEHDIDLASSWMVGDSESDVEAGIAAGCRTVLVAPRGTSSRADFVADSLAEAWDLIRTGSPDETERI
jgi:D-glycero-D-manno-heptose 1,7-bisphosphate phosphatase